jgi:hypothetical protein
MQSPDRRRPLRPRIATACRRGSEIDHDIEGRRLQQIVQPSASEYPTNLKTVNQKFKPLTINRNETLTITRNNARVVPSVPQCAKTPPQSPTRRGLLFWWQRQPHPGANRGLDLLNRNGAQRASNRHRENRRP